MRLREFNSLAPGKFEYSLKLVNFKRISRIDILSIFCEIAIRWMPQRLTGHQSTLVQVIAWCRQATSYYLSQCWLRSLSPYDVTMPQLVNYQWPKVGKIQHHRTRGIDSGNGMWYNRHQANFLSQCSLLNEPSLSLITMFSDERRFEYDTNNTIIVTSYQV